MGKKSKAPNIISQSGFQVRPRGRDTTRRPKYVLSLKGVPVDNGSLVPFYRYQIV